MTVGAGKRARWRRGLGRAGACVLAIAAAAIAAEFLLPEPAQFTGAIWRQARGSIEEHEPGKLRPRAHWSGVQTVGGGVQRVRHNALGMRGPEVTPKQSGERRVLFLGDSVTYGIGVQEEETFALQVASLLARTYGGQVTTGIAACPGFGIRDHVDLLRRAHDAFAPDLIVSCVFVENDLYDDLQLERGVFAGYPVFQAPQLRLLRSSWRARLAIASKVAYQLEQLLLRALPSLALDVRGAALSPPEAALWDGIAWDQSVLFLEQSPPPPPAARLFTRARDALAALQQAAGRVPLAVVLIPSYVQYVPHVFAHLAAQRPAESNHVRGTAQAQLRAHCDALGLPAFDLLPDLLAQSEVPPLLIPNDYHFTPRGHAVVARLLTPWLAARLR
jgi:lysophospholipase L1-like esterase